MRSWILLIFPSSNKLPKIGPSVTGVIAYTSPFATRPTWFLFVSTENPTNAPPSADDTLIPFCSSWRAADKNASPASLNRVVRVPSPLPYFGLSPRSFISSASSTSSGLGASNNNIKYVKESLPRLFRTPS